MNPVAMDLVMPTGPVLLAGWGQYRPAPNTGARYHIDDCGLRPDQMRPHRLRQDKGYGGIDVDKEPPRIGRYRGHMNHARDASNTTNNMNVFERFCGCPGEGCATIQQGNIRRQCLTDTGCAICLGNGLGRPFCGDIDRQNPRFGSRKRKRFGTSQA